MDEELAENVECLEIVLARWVKMNKRRYNGVDIHGMKTKVFVKMFGEMDSMNDSIRKFRKYIKPKQVSFFLLQYLQCGLPAFLSPLQRQALANLGGLWGLGFLCSSPSLGVPILFKGVPRVQRE